MKIVQKDSHMDQVRIYYVKQYRNISKGENMNSKKSKDIDDYKK